MAHIPKILIIKTSSLGDVVHMLPAITDAARQQPQPIIDWVVEEGFAEVPRWHPAIRQVIPVAIRRWRKQLFNPQVRQQISAFKSSLQREQYDAVIDAQGLLKSAGLALLARGIRYGYDRHSIREPLASWLYQQHFSVSQARHAITRNRLLMAHALGYSIANLPLDYGMAATHFPPTALSLPTRYIVALHGTSRVDKEWPETHWQTLIAKLAAHGISTLLPWGNAREKARADRLALTHTSVQVLPRSALSELAGILQNALGVIGMDTGLMHIAAALGKPGLALYPVTAPELTGVLGNSNALAKLEVLSGSQTQDANLVTGQFLTLLGSSPLRNQIAPHA